MMVVGCGLCVLVHWIGNHDHALTPSPSPTGRGRGESTLFLHTLRQNHTVKAPRPRTGEGLGVRGSDTG